MNLQYKEKVKITRENWGQDLAALGLTAPEHLRVIRKQVEEAGAATISFYQFRHSPSAPPGDLLVCHDTGKAAINFGGNLRWGDWDPNYEIITLANGEKFNFDGKPLDFDDEGACSLGNV